MKSAETPILNTDNNQKEEKVKISYQSFICKNAYLIPFILLFLASIAGTIGLFLTLPGNLVFLVPLLYIFCVIFNFSIARNGAEIIINNINHTLSLRETRLCDCCCKKSPRIIDLTQVEKMYINSYKFPDCFTGNIGTYNIIYKNGTTEDISDYFRGCKEECSINGQNLFRKYIKVNDRNPGIEKNTETLKSKHNVASGSNSSMNHNQEDVFSSGHLQNCSQENDNINVNMNAAIDANDYN